MLRRVPLRTVVYRSVAPLRVATVCLVLAVFVLQVERGGFSTGSGFLLYGTVLLCYAGLASTSNWLSCASICYLMLTVCCIYAVLCYIRLWHAMLCNADHMLCHALLDCAMLCCPLLCSSMVCYKVLCYMMSTCWCLVYSSVL